MNKTQLRKRLTEIKADYFALNDEGEKSLKGIVVKRYLDCFNLDSPDLKAHLIKAGLVINVEEIEDELPDYETAQDIIDSFKYDLTLLEEDELIQSKKVKKSIEKAEVTQNKISRTTIDRQSFNAGIGVSLLFGKTNFHNEGQQVTGLDMATIMEVIEEQEELLKKGDLSSLENMLHSQVHTLNAMFTHMVAHMSLSKHIKNTEAYARIALKSQNQTRQTISTLAELKGLKRTVFIHQNNMATNQQINNNGARENLNDSSNEKSIDNVDTAIETGSKRQNQSDETLALSERDKNTGGIETLSNELIKARHEGEILEGVGETISRN